MENPKYLRNKALKLKNENKFKEAIDEIEKAIKKDPYDWESWNIKAELLDNIGKLDDAIKTYDIALDINNTDKIKINKAETLYKISKNLFFPSQEYEESLNIINQSLDILPEDYDKSEFYFLKAEILESLNDRFEAKRYYLKANNELDELQVFDMQLNYLKENSDRLINISGTDFFEGTTPLKDGTTVDLIIEEDNEHDADAIRVELDKKPVGYVANSPYTLFKYVKSASDIKNKIKDNQKAKIQFFFGNYIIAELLD